MSKLTIPSDITTVQDLERYSGETGQDFWTLLEQHLSIIDTSTTADVYETSRRLGVRPSQVIPDAWYRQQEQEGGR